MIHVAATLIALNAHAQPTPPLAAGPCAVEGMNCEGPADPIEFEWRREPIDAPSLRDAGAAYDELFYQVWLRYSDRSAPGHPHNPLSKGFREDVVVTVGCNGSGRAEPGASVSYTVARLSGAWFRPALAWRWLPTQRFLVATARSNSRTYLTYLPYLVSSMRGIECEAATALRSAVLRELDVLLEARHRVRRAQLMELIERSDGTPP